MAEETKKVQKIDFHAPASPEAQVLVYMMERYRQTKSEKDLASVMECLKDVRLQVQLVPREVTADGKKQIQMGIGLITTKDTEKKYIAAYTNPDQIPVDMRERIALGAMPFDSVKKFADSAADCSGIVIDPFSTNFRIETVKEGSADSSSEKKEN